MASTGVPRMITRLVAYIAQTKSGSRNQVRPGARILWIVTMKLMAVKMEEKTTIKIPTAVRMTAELA